MKTLLARVLHFTWDELHAEAERLEHAVSEVLADRIDERLGFPSVDPHGDPIPDAVGRWRADISTLRKLAECAPGDRVTLRRVVDQRPVFLRYLLSNGLTIGSALRVDTVSPIAGVIRVTVAGKSASLGKAAAQCLEVEEDNEP